MNATLPGTTTLAAFHPISTKLQLASEAQMCLVEITVINGRVVIYLLQAGCPGLSITLFSSRY